MTVDSTAQAHEIQEDVAPTEPGNSRRIVSRNPATKEVIASVPVSSEREIEEAVERAREAQSFWGRLPFEERGSYLLDVRDALLDHRGELVDLVCEEAGTERTIAQFELFVLCDTLGFYAEKAEELLGDQSVRPHLVKHKRVEIDYEPAGLIVNISPWNFPLDLSMSPIAPALATGNAAIIKPSEWTPLVAERAVDIASSAGLPEGLLQSVPGYGETGSMLIDHADAVSFTGSVSTGRKVARASGENLITSTLELGGKDPALVLADAELDRTTKGVVWGAFFNAGQCCMSTERAFVHEEIYDEFVERVVQMVRDLRIGNPCEEGVVDIGAITFPGQLDTIERHVEGALRDGAEALTGGKRPEDQPGFFFEPTVLVDVDPSMEVMNEETFGPVLPIMKVPSSAEAVRLANESQYGLNSSIWTRDTERARRIASQLEVGNVCINDILTSYGIPEAPYGGVKASGVGRRKGHWELDDFTEPKTVLTDRLGLEQEPWWMPYNETVHHALDRAFDALFRKDWWNKIRAMWK